MNSTHTAARRLTMVGLALATAGLPARAQTNITNATLSQRPAGDLADTIRQLTNQQGPAWIAYAVAAHDASWEGCCQGHASSCCGGCRLERGGTGAGRRVASRGTSASVPLEPGDRAIVLLRVVDRQVQTVRALSERCTIDAGGRPVVWLESVREGSSLALLAGLAGRQPEGGKTARAIRDGALLAIAVHHGPDAERALAVFLRPERPLVLRKQAAFWAASLRGRAGFDLVRAAVRADRTDAAFREHGAFAFSQSDVPEATTALIELAGNDPSPGVRAQALFWLAQQASQQAAGAITEALQRDPDTTVQERAVFALSQLPGEDGVPKLIDVARTHTNPRVRQKAMFWLGQSNDPRALAFFADVLSKQE